MEKRTGDGVGETKKNIQATKDTVFQVERFWQPHNLKKIKHDKTSAARHKDYCSNIRKGN